MPTSANHPANDTTRILLVEDEPGAAGALQVMLRRAHVAGDGGELAVDLAGSLGDARAAAAAHPPALVLLDLTLPDSGGLSSIASMHDLLPATPIVVLATSSAPDLADAALRAGAQDVLVKGDYDIGELGRVLRHAMSRSQLEARLHLLDAALSAADNGIVVTDAQARIEWINPAFVRLTGYNLKEAMGRKPKELIGSGLNPDAIYKEMWATIPNGRTWRGELINRRKDGTLYHEELTITPVLDDQGAVRHYVAVKQDISERKQQESALAETRARLELALAGADLGTWDWHVSSGTVIFNRRWASMLGYSLDELAPNVATWRRLAHPDDLDAIRTALVPHLKGLTDRYESMHRLAHKDEHWVWVLDRGRVVERDAEGRAVRIVGTHLDISAQKQAEEALQARANRLDTLLRSIQDLIFVIDTMGRIVECHAPRPDMLMMPKEKFLGLTYGEILPPDTADRFDVAIAGIFEDGAPREVRYALPMPDGEHHYRATVSQLVGSGQFPNGFLVVVHDTTEQVLAERGLRVAAKAFESQEGMLITDAGEVIQRVNQALVRTTGYSAAELVGATPRVLASGRHDEAFFTEMWAAIGNDGVWQGEIWNRRKNGEVYPQWMTISAVKDDEGIVQNYVGALTDITERKAAEEEIRNLAFFDPLTRLPNRRLLLDRLQRALVASQRSGRQGALLFIDLDNFKSLNDTYGHDMGDLLLQQVAQRLLDGVREGDTVARLGGDEFVVMLEGLAHSEKDAAPQAEVIGDKLLIRLNQPYALSGQVHHSTPSIGVTLFGGERLKVEELMKRADLAMYQSKAAGRNTLRFFDPQMQAAVEARSALEADLRRGIVAGQFLLHYQVQVDRDGRPIGVEALVRWQHPERGRVSPADFIPLAEETGLILRIGHWVLETACRQLVVWAASPATAHLSIAVNVSARQFRQPGFADEVLTALAQTGADPRRLKLELTESLLLDDIEGVIAKMTALQQHGVSFSLDDFGTGYSSLSYLKRLPLDQLKIDQGFVRDVLTDPNDAAIAQTVVALGNSLGLAVIAEGVETEAQRDFLLARGCQAFQGYLFGRPGPAEDVLALL